MGSVTISEDEYAELKRKAEAYEKIQQNNSKAGKASASNMTAKERSERAKKAVEARIKKYGQKKGKQDG